MRVVGYLRVSTDRQGEDGLGLEQQEHAIRQWARAHRHRIVAWYRDVGQSGSNGLDTRTGLLDALDALTDGRAGAVVVYRLDRLARDVVLQEALLRDMRSAGGDLYSTFDGENENLRDDPEDPSRRLIRVMLGAVADYERSLIALRLRRGRRRKSERGGYAGGRPPLGYRAEDRELVPDEDEQRVLARVRELRRDDPDVSLRTIAAALTAEGYRTKRGGPWHPFTVSQICKRLDV